MFAKMAINTCKLYCFNKFFLLRQLILKKYYSFETQNGINAEESGRIEPDGNGSEGLRSTGFYEYVGDDGQLYRVDYVADSNGFIPQGDHIPKVPPAIEKLLAYLASQPK